MIDQMLKLAQNTGKALKSVRNPFLLISSMDNSNQGYNALNVIMFLLLLIHSTCSVFQFLHKRT